MARCTLTTIASAAEVSVSTVSYALRNHPKIPRATALRIQQLARRLGYKTHPGVAALMTHIRLARQPRYAEKIAFVWVEAAPTEANAPFNRQILDGARARAIQLGYQLEEFWLTQAGMTPRRLSEILKTRNIAGIVFSGCDRQTDMRLEMDWDAHACAIIGNARWNPELHRAGHYHFMSMRRVMSELLARGYRRPAAFLEEVVNERASHVWDGAFLALHPVLSNPRRFLYNFSQLNEAETRRWLQQTKPDAVIVTKPIFVAPLRRIAAKLGLDLGFAVLDLLGEHGKLAGIDPGHRMVASNAVDLVTAQLYRNERGVPADPMKLLFDGHWVEGESLRPPPSRQEQIDSSCADATRGPQRPRVALP